MNAPSSSGKARAMLGLNPIEAVGVMVVLGLVGAWALLWTSLKLTGLIFTGGAPKLSNPIRVLGVLGHPFNMDKAFPAADRSHIAPSLIVWVFVFALGAGLVYLGLIAYRRLSGITRDPNAVNWAKPNDLRTLIVNGPMPGRLVIGRSSGKLLATEPRQSVIILGPTQTVKTTGLAVPAILEWQGPVIAASVKNDLVKDTIKWRRRQGEVWLFDPTRSTGFDYEDVRAGWSPISASQDWGGARKVASWLCKSAKGSQGNLSDGDFWYAAAEKLMAPFLFAAAQGKRDMAEVLRWIDANEEAEVMGILARAGVEEAALAFAANMRRDERTRNSIFTTAETILGAYADPLVAESAEHPAIFPENLLNGKNNTLYVCAPSHEQDRLQPVFTALVAQMKTYAYELAGKQNRPVDPALLLVIDEAANIAPLSDLDAIASTAAGIGIQLVTVFQDFAQIEARYDKRARTVVNNHRAKVVLSGISDPGTLDYVKQICGDQDIEQTSVTVNGDGVRSSTESINTKALASAGMLRRMRPGEGLVVYGHLLPAKIELRPWYKDTKLKSRVETGFDPVGPIGKARPGSDAATPPTGAPVGAPAQPGPPGAPPRPPMPPRPNAGPGAPQAPGAPVPYPGAPRVPAPGAPRAPQTAGLPQAAAAAPPFPPQPGMPPMPNVGNRRPSAAPDGMSGQQPRPPARPTEVPRHDWPGVPRPQPGPGAVPQDARPVAPSPFARPATPPARPPAPSPFAAPTAPAPRPGVPSPWGAPGAPPAQVRPGRPAGEAEDADGSTAGAGDGTKKSDSGPTKRPPRVG